MGVSFHDLSGLRQGDGVGEEHAARVAVVADAPRDEREAGDEGGGEGVGEQQGGVVLAWADLIGGLLGGHHAVWLEDMQFVEEGGAAEELVVAGAAEGADEDAGHGVADARMVGVAMTTSPTGGGRGEAEYGRSGDGIGGG
ncbi:MAG: hypothetical protein R3B67_13820 [Phycisphaerales bacterium]